MKHFLLNKLIATLSLLWTTLTWAQKPVIVTLQTNYKASLKIYHDEPVLLTISISNKKAQEDSRWNFAADRRLSELEELVNQNKVSREDYNTEKKQLTDGKKKINTVNIGSSTEGWASSVKWVVEKISNGEKISLNIKVLANPATENIAVLDDNGIYQAYFGISPDDMRKIPDGEYMVTTILEGVSSKPVNIVIQKEDMPPVIANSEEMLLRIGRFYWHADNSTKAIEYAEKVLKIKSTSIDGLSLKGNSLVMMGSYQAALESYNEALKQFYIQNVGHIEPPEFLQLMIDFVKTKL